MESQRKDELKPTSRQASEDAMDKTSRDVHYLPGVSDCDSRDSTPEGRRVFGARHEINFLK